MLCSSLFYFSVITLLRIYLLLFSFYKKRGQVPPAPLNHMCQVGKNKPVTYKSTLKEKPWL
jgi:hypothetical protein